MTPFARYVQRLTVLAIVAFLSFKTASGNAPLTDPAKRWPGGIVYYTIDSSLSSDVPEIQRAIDHIEANTCVHYVERTNQPNFVSFRLVTPDMGCTAPVGFQGNVEHKIAINRTECDFFPYYVHQLIQILGMNHEHQRSDRDKYIKVNTSNVDPGSVRYFEKLDPSKHSRSTYDVDSIMHYGSLRFSNNGEPTMLFVDGSRIQDLQEKTELTPLDIMGINTYYNCPSAAGHLSLSSAFSLTLMALCTAFGFGLRR